MNHFPCGGDRQAIQVPPPGKNPEALSYTLKSSHWGNEPLINEQLAPKPLKSVETRLLANTRTMTAKKTKGRTLKKTV